MTAPLSERLRKEPCRLCVNWVNDNDCEIGMPQEVCPSRKEIQEVLKMVAGLEAKVSDLNDQILMKDEAGERLKAENTRLEKIMTAYGINELIKKVENVAKENYDLKARLAAMVKIIDGVRDALNNNFGIGWIEKFEAENYETCDSLNTSNDVAKIIREAALGEKV